MRWKEWLLNIFFKWLLLPLLILFIAWFYRWLPWIQQDNPVEEAIEVYIKEYSGQDIDLSPDTKEKGGN